MHDCANSCAQKDVANCEGTTRQSRAVEFSAMKVLEKILKEPGDYVILAAIGVLLGLLLMSVVEVVVGAIHSNYTMLVQGLIIVAVCVWGIYKMLWAMEYVRNLRAKE